MPGRRTPEVFSSVNTEPLRVCLERTVELAGTRLRLRDWPGIGGPLVHVPDLLAPHDALVEALAAACAPRYRVLSLEPRAEQPYQIQAAELRATLAQFGFAEPVVVGERLGCVTALVLAAWYPASLARLVLIDPTYAAPFGHVDSLAARALRDCPPDWPTLRGAVQCPVREVRWADAPAAQDLPTFLQLP